MNDELNLVNAILSSPEDDTLRLAYADWLDENDSLIDCVRCRSSSGYCFGCNDCSFTGKVRNGLANRAEFIRFNMLTPVKLESHGRQWIVQTDIGSDDIEENEKSLFMTIGRWNAILYILNKIPCLRFAPSTVTFNRGFIESIECLSSDWEEVAKTIFKNKHIPQHGRTVNQPIQYVKFTDPIDTINWIQRLNFDIQSLPYPNNKFYISALYPDIKFSLLYEDEIELTEKT